MKRIGILLIALGFFHMGMKGQILDRIVAVIGDKIILSSQVEDNYNYYIINGQKDDGTLKCSILENLILDKLMLNKAELDSIVVSESQVDSEVDRRVQFTLQQMNGSTEEFENIYGKPVLQFKEDIHEEVKEQLLINRQKSTIFEEATITPREVKEFFATIPKDSLGLLPAEIQLNHIVINVPWSEESKDVARKELLEYRRQIMEDGKDFSDLAKRYSEDPGSRVNGGSLGQFGRGMMVAKFEEVVYSMREGDISDVVETEFGFHIIQLHKRQGELVEASHILRKPKPSLEGDSVVLAKFGEIQELIEIDSLTFEEAAIVYSEDRASKDCGGCITNPKAPGELDVPLDALPADMYFKVESMAAGEVSPPLKIDETSGQTGRPAYHVIFVKKKIPPHAPNLKDDYKTIYNAALRARQGEILDAWVESAKKNIYIDIKPNECSNALKNWTN